MATRRKKSKSTQKGSFDETERRIRSILNNYRALKLKDEGALLVDYCLRRLSQDTEKTQQILLLRLLKVALQSPEYRERYEVYEREWEKLKMSMKEESANIDVDAAELQTNAQTL